jgi:hypothetical protein
MNVKQLPSLSTPKEPGGRIGAFLRCFPIHWLSLRNPPIGRTFYAVVRTNRQARSSPVWHWKPSAVALSVHPTASALCEAARCHSVGALRRLLVSAYGERGLSLAYQLAGREQPRKMLSSQVKSGEPAPGQPDLLSPEVLRSLPLQVGRFFLHEPRTPPRWRTTSPPDGADDGSWCG